MNHVEASPGAQHIFLWARNDAAMVQAMRKVRVPGEFLTVRGQSVDAVNLANRALIDMRKCGEEGASWYDAGDVLQAALLFLAWDGES